MDNLAIEALPVGGSIITFCQYIGTSAEVQEGQSPSFSSLSFFFEEERDGIGLMHRAFKGTAPNGQSWDDVANAAAGKQSSGYAAFGSEYLQSRKFLQADGGWQRIVWMSQELKEKFAPDKTWIATEADVKNLQELAKFLKAKRG